MTFLSNKRAADRAAASHAARVLAIVSTVFTLTATVLRGGHAEAQSTAETLTDYRQKNMAGAGLRVGFLQRRPGAVQLEFAQPLPPDKKNQASLAGALFAIADARDLQLTLTANAHLLRSNSQDKDTVTEILRTLARIKGINAVVVARGVLADAPFLTVLPSPNQTEPLFLKLDNRAISSRSLLQQAAFRALGYNAVVLRLPSGSIEVYRAPPLKDQPLPLSSQIVVFRPQAFPVSPSSRVIAVLAPLQQDSDSRRTEAGAAQAILSDASVWPQIQAAPAVVVE